MHGISLSPDGCVRLHVGCNNRLQDFLLLIFKNLKYTDRVKWNGAEGALFFGKKIGTPKSNTCLKIFLGNRQFVTCLCWFRKFGSTIVGSALSLATRSSLWLNALHCLCVVLPSTYASWFPGWFGISAVSTISFLQTSARESFNLQRRE